MKYRISSYKSISTKGKDLFTFVPEKRYKYWPFWLSFNHHYFDETGSYGALQFDSFEDAKKFLTGLLIKTKWTRNGCPIEVK